MKLWRLVALSLQATLAHGVSLSTRVAERAARAHRPGLDSEHDLDTERDIDGRPSFARPHFNDAMPELIEYGIYVKGVSAVDMLKGCFTADIVMSLQWHDPSVKKFVEKLGTNSVTLSQREAEKYIWLPDVRISNRAVRGVDEISSTTIASDNGTVRKVDRLLAVVNNQYIITHYPFDSQNLIIKLTSENLMADELRFIPDSDPDSNGYSSTLLSDTDFSIDGFRTMIYDEIDGHLHKSRGAIDIKINRISAPYFQSLLLPELLVLCMSLSVFWFPALGVFAMPRVATALISFLTLTTLGLRTNSLLPVRGGLVWIDLFELCCQALMLFALILNILVLVLFHTFQEEELASKIDNELKILFPILAFIAFSLCFYNTNGNNLLLLSLAVNYIIISGTTIYLGWCFYRLHRKLFHKDLALPPNSARSATTLEELFAEEAAQRASKST